VATLTQPGQPDRRIALARRSNTDCLAEELRRLDPDDIFGEVVLKGLPALESARSVPLADAERTGDASSPAAAQRRGEELDAQAAQVAADIAAAEPEGIELGGAPTAAGAEGETTQGQPERFDRSGEAGVNAS